MSGSTDQRLDWVARRADNLGGELEVPGDKSISHRAVMFGAIADGVTEITNFLPGADCRATAAAMQAMGVTIETLAHDHLRVHGVGMRGLHAPAQPLDLGNSGTSMRLFSGLLAGQEFGVTLTGDSSLCSRPMRRVTEPLARMGARLTTTPAGTAPLQIEPAGTLRGLHYELPVASAQVKSAVLLAGLYADGRTTTVEPRVTRDHTERMLCGFGYSIEVDGPRASLIGGGCLTATPVPVPGDLSSAAFFMVAAAIVPGASVLLRNVGINPTRTGIIEILRRMGADVEVHNERLAAGEPVADIRVTGAPLRGIEIDAELVALAIDEMPVAFVAAAAAQGVTRVSGAEELRVKESDRIGAMAAGLAANGVDATAHPDGITITGGGIRGGGRVVTHGDHRIAMAFAVAAQIAREPIVIEDCRNVDTSFPNFMSCAHRCGFELETVA